MSSVSVVAAAVYPESGREFLDVLVDVEICRFKLVVCENRTHVVIYYHAFLREMMIFEHPCSIIAVSVPFTFSSSVCHLLFFFLTLFFRFRYSE